MINSWKGLINPVVWSLEKNEYEWRDIGLINGGIVSRLADKDRWRDSEDTSRGGQMEGVTKQTER